MGDHAIGVRMGLIAVAWWTMRKNRKPTKAQALKALDTICMPYRGRDAEFEAIDPDNPSKIHRVYNEYTDPNGPLGRLIAIAFDAQPYEMYIVGNDDECPWLDGPYMRFANRYKFV